VFSRIEKRMRKHEKEGKNKMRKCEKEGENRMKGGGRDADLQIRINISGIVIE